MHLQALTNENRLLKTLHKRQDTALAKYEGTNAELPQLLHSHAEELRTWHTKYRTASVRNRDLNAQLKQKDDMILKLSERNKHLTQLNDDKWVKCGYNPRFWFDCDEFYRNLEARETLSGKVHYLELRLAEMDEEIKMLIRRNHLEAKNFKVQLHNEQKKYKILCQKLDNAATKMHVPIANDSGDEMSKVSASDLHRVCIPDNFLFSDQSQIQ